MKKNGHNIERQNHKTVYLERQTGLTNRTFIPPISLLLTCLSYTEYCRPLTCLPSESPISLKSLAQRTLQDLSDSCVNLPFQSNPHSRMPCIQVSVKDIEKLLLQLL